jgi:DNA end-binding protein Ku
MHGTRPMARAIWTGAIHFGLVTIPVRLFGATRTKSLSFHLLHEKDMGRVHNERVCDVCGKKVAWNDLVRGYEYEKDTYVPISDDDLKKANVEATQSVEIVDFVEAAEIDPVLYDTPYYLEPEKRGRHAYALLREALEKSGRVGIARVVLRTREHLAALTPDGDALVLELLRWPDEIIPPSSLELPAPPVKVPAAEMKSAMMLIDAMTSEKFDGEAFHDRYRDQVMAMIEARAHGKSLPKYKAKAPKATVVDLADVLRKSLEQTKKHPPKKHRAPPKRHAA